MRIPRVYELKRSDSLYSECSGYFWPRKHQIRLRAYSDEECEKPHSWDYMKACLAHELAHVIYLKHGKHHTKLARLFTALVFEIDTRKKREL